jgi:hypothetical protein
VETNEALRAADAIAAALRAIGRKRGRLINLTGKRGAGRAFLILAVPQGASRLRSDTSKTRAKD